MKAKQKMRIKRRVLLVTIAVFAVAAATVSWMRIDWLNRSYPQAELIPHRMGDEIRGGDISLTFFDSRLVSGDALRKTFPDYKDPVMNADMTPVRDEQRYVLMADVRIKNQSAAEKSVSLVQIYAESVSWANGIDGSLFSLLNSDDRDPMRVALQPGEERVITLPYSIYEFQFSPENWDTIQDRLFDLTLSYYPARNIVTLA